MYQNFVTLSHEDIPNDFVQFTDLDILIDHQQIDEDKPIYLSIDESARKGRLSEVCIDQLNDQGGVKHLAYFYTHFGYTKALKLLLDSEDNLEKYRLFITGKNRTLEDRIDVVITFFIKASYLLKLYEEY